MTVQWYKISERLATSAEKMITVVVPRVDMVTHYGRYSKMATVGTCYFFRRGPCSAISLSGRGRPQQPLLPLYGYRCSIHQGCGYPDKPCLPRKP